MKLMESTADQPKKLDPSIEDRYLRALLEYPKLVKISVGRLEPDNFLTIEKSNIFRVLQNYLKQVSEPPTYDLWLLTMKEQLNDAQYVLAERVLTRINKEVPAPSWEWMVSKLGEFTDTIVINDALITAYNMIEEGQVKDARDKLVKAIRGTGIGQQIEGESLDLSEEDILDIAKESNTFCCPTRIAALDDEIKGFYRKELFVLMASLNVGKSWFVTHSVVSALLSGKHVLYFTLEMSRQAALARIVQHIAGVKRGGIQDDLTAPAFVWKVEGDDQWTMMEEMLVPTMSDVKHVKKSIDALKRWGGKLVIREYPDGFCKISDIEKDIETYDATLSKLPDIIFVDGLLNLDFYDLIRGGAMRECIAQAVKEFRRLAVEYDASVVLTHQANRQAIGKIDVGAEHTGEAIDVMRTADTGVVLSQDEFYRERSQSLLTVVRARQHSKGRKIEVWQNLDLGHFCMASMRKQSAAELAEQQAREKK